MTAKKSQKSPKNEVAVDQMEIEAQKWAEFEAEAAGEEVVAPVQSETLTFALYSNSPSCYVVLRQDDVFEYLYKKNVRSSLMIEGTCLVSLELDAKYVDRMNVRKWAFKEELTPTLSRFARCKVFAA